MVSGSTKHALRSIDRDAGNVFMTKRTILHHSNSSQIALSHCLLTTRARGKQLLTLAILPSVMVGEDVLGRHLQSHNCSQHCIHLHMSSSFVSLWMQKVSQSSQICTTKVEWPSGNLSSSTSFIAGILTAYSQLSQAIQMHYSTPLL
jgi:hypothetical protein